MHVVDGARLARPWRALLLVGGGALLWTLVTLFSPTSSAHAADDDPSGLLGAVTTTAAGVMDAGTSATSAVSQAVQTTLTPVVKAVPAPVRAAAAPVVTAAAPAVKAVAHAAAKIESVVQEVVESSLATVSDVVAATPLAPVVGTPGALVPPLVAVGSEIAPEPAAHSAAAATAGAPEPWLRAASAAAVASVAAAIPSWVWTPAGGLPNDSAAPSPASISTTAAFALLAALALFRSRRVLPAFSTPSPRDDALPGAPVYETDTSPG